MIATAAQIAAALVAVQGRIAAAEGLGAAERATYERDAFRAASHLAEGVEYGVEGERVWFASQSRPGKRHWTLEDRCLCGARGCWHVLGRRLVLAMPGLAAPVASGACYCGRALGAGWTVAGEAVLVCGPCGREYQIAPQFAA